MDTPKDITRIFEPYTPIVDEGIKRVLGTCPHLDMYDMMRYFLGFTDAHGRAVRAYAGKRFRPGLCLLLAEAYGVQDQALGVAASIELFHNFTLMHDDIEDHDELRRGRATVWKVWGVNHAINAGDAQLILAHRALGQAVTGKGAIGAELQQFLTGTYLQVIEGQFLDFRLADARLEEVSEEAYYEMIRRKSAVLVGAAAKSAGMLGGCAPEEQELLWQYGVALGMAYQIYDDIVSIWGSEAASGKMPYKDIVEKKKTLPLIYVWRAGSSEVRADLARAYAAEFSVGARDAVKIIDHLDAAHAYEYVWGKVKEFAEQAKKAASGLTLPDKTKGLLTAIVDALLVPVR